MVRKQLLPLLFLLAAITLLGCSKNKLAPAKVSGRITYNGQPLKAGNLQFWTADGVAYSGQISKDGTYVATDLPEGEMVITVETESFNTGRKIAGAGRDTEKRSKMGGQQQPPADRGGGVSTPPPAELYVKIPDKYNNRNTSPLSVTLTSGRQVKDLELMP